jgi:2-keto-3-deoxy-L-arabinonate dehydratase
MIDFSGVYPILYAYFGRDGRLDHGAMRVQIEACLRLSPAGIAVLGLATEVEKLSFEEKHAIVALASEMTTGRMPLAVTIAAPSIEERFRLIDLAYDYGASWLILQPPPDAGLDEAALLTALAALIKRAEIPSAIQHAPQYLGVNLNAKALMGLRQEFSAFRLLKSEGSALETAELIEATESAFSLFAGRGGLEWPDMLRCGASGLIPAPELLDSHLAIWRAANSNDWATADNMYAKVLPLITFIMQSLASCRCYGKRLLARRIGLGEVYDRQPSLLPTPIGMKILDHWSSFLKPWQ